MPSYKFLAYLWGIETDKIEDTEAKIKEFLAYLWGIETECTGG